jgi:hypothetical protein
VASTHHTLETAICELALLCLQAETNPVFSLINLNEPAPAQGRVRRQSAESNTPLIYNLTQAFSASANTSYALTAWAAVANPADNPYCFMTICGDSDCSFAIPITTRYTRFTYDYLSPLDENGALATFSVACTAPAYVAVDDVSVTNSDLAAVSSSANPVSTATTTVFATETVVQTHILTQIETTAFVSGSEVVLTTTIPTVVYQTINNPITETVIQTQVLTQIETTTFISGSEVILTTTVPTVVYQTVNIPITETRTVSTLLLATETATAAVPQYVNITVSSISTTTSRLYFYPRQLLSCLVHQAYWTSHTHKNPQFDCGIISALVSSSD